MSCVSKFKGDRVKWSSHDDSGSQMFETNKQGKQLVGDGIQAGSLLVKQMFLSVSPTRFSQARKVLFRSDVSFIQLWQNSSCPLFALVRK